MKKHSLLFVVAIFGLTACTEPIEYPITYSSIPITGRNTAIFTKNGKIKDKKVINNFLKRYGNFYPNLDIVISKYKYLKATYISPISVIFSSSSADEADTLTVHDKDGLV